jgi:hypothetical protein
MPTDWSEFTADDSAAAAGVDWSQFEADTNAVAKAPAPALPRNSEVAPQDTSNYFLNPPPSPTSPELEGIYAKARKDARPTKAQLADQQAEIAARGEVGLTDYLASPFTAAARIGWKATGRALQGLDALAASTPPGILNDMEFDPEWDKKRAAMTPEQKRKELEAGPLFQFGQGMHDTAGESFVNVDPEGIPTKLGEGAGGFLPAVLTGPLAPAVFGLQTAGEQLTQGYDELIKQGADPGTAADTAAKRAVQNGTMQGLLFEFLPKPLKSIGDTALDKLAYEGTKRWLAGRVANTAKGAAFGAGTQVAANLSNEHPWYEGIGEAAAGMALIDAIMPRGMTKAEVKEYRQNALDADITRQQVEFNITREAFRKHLREKAQLTDEHLGELDRLQYAVKKGDTLTPEQADRLKALEFLTGAEKNVLLPEQKAMVDQVAKEQGIDWREQTEEGMGHDQYTGRVAYYDTKAGKVVINPAELSLVMSGIKPARRKAYLESLLAEENIHGMVTDKQAVDFVRNATLAEKEAAVRRYTGTASGRTLEEGKKISEVELGHEMIRAKIQQLMGIKPTELASSSAGLHRELTAGLLKIENIIQAVREVAARENKDKPVNLQNAILETVWHKINTVKEQAGVDRENQPFSVRRSDVEAMTPEEQSKLGHKAGIEYGITLGKDDVPALEKSYNQAQEEMGKIFEGGYDQSKEKKWAAAFGRSNFYGGALQGATKGEHKAAAGNYDLYVKSQQQPASVRRPDYSKTEGDIEDHLKTVEQGIHFVSTLMGKPKELREEADKLESFIMDRIHDIDEKEGTNYHEDAPPSEFSVKMPDELMDLSPGIHNLEQALEWVGRLRHREIVNRTDQQGFSPASLRRGEKLKDRLQRQAAELRLRKLEAEGVPIPEELKKTLGLREHGTVEQPTPVPPEERTSTNFPRLTSKTMEAEAEAEINRPTNAKGKLKMAEAKSEIGRNNPAPGEKVSRMRVEAERPSFDRFAKKMRDVTVDVKKEQLQEIWADRVWGELTKASPERLAELRKALGLEGKYGSRAMGEDPLGRRDITGPEKAPEVTSEQAMRQREILRKRIAKLEEDAKQKLRDADNYEANVTEESAKPREGELFGATDQGQALRQQAFELRYKATVMRRSLEAAGDESRTLRRKADVRPMTHVPMGEVLKEASGEAKKRLTELQSQLKSMEDAGVPSDDKDVIRVENEIEDLQQKVRGESGVLNRPNRPAERAGMAGVSQAAYRQKVIRAIAQQLIGESYKHENRRANMDRTEISVDDVDFTNKKTQVGSYYEITPGDLEIKRDAHGNVPDITPPLLAKILRDQARGKNTDPESASRRVLVVVGPDNKVHLLSVYNDAGRTMVTDPEVRGSHRPYRELTSGFIKKYHPVSTLLLKDPVKGLRQELTGMAEFRDRIGQEAKERSEVGDNLLEGLHPEQHDVEGTAGLEGNMGLFQGPKAGNMDLEQRNPALHSKAPLSRLEAFMVSKYESTREVRDAIEDLQLNLKEGRKLSPRGVVLVNAFRKISERIEAGRKMNPEISSDPELSQQQTIDRVANRLMWFNQSPTPVKAMLREFGSQLPESLPRNSEVGREIQTPPKYSPNLHRAFRRGSDKPMLPRVPIKPPTRQDVFAGPFQRKAAPSGELGADRPYIPEGMKAEAPGEREAGIKEERGYQLEEMRDRALRNVIRTMRKRGKVVPVDVALKNIGDMTPSDIAEMKLRGPMSTRRVEIPTDLTWIGKAENLSDMFRRFQRAASMALENKDKGQSLKMAKQALDWFEIYHEQMRQGLRDEEFTTKIPGPDSQAESEFQDKVRQAIPLAEQAKKVLADWIKREEGEQSFPASVRRDYVHDLTGAQEKKVPFTPTSNYWMDRDGNVYKVLDHEDGAYKIIQSSDNKSTTKGFSDTSELIHKRGFARIALDRDRNYGVFVQANDITPSQRKALKRISEDHNIGVTWDQWPGGKQELFKPWSPSSVRREKIKRYWDPDVENRGEGRTVQELPDYIHKEDWDKVRKVLDGMGRRSEVMGPVRNDGDAMMRLQSMATEPEKEWDWVPTHYIAKGPDSAMMGEHYGITTSEKNAIKDFFRKAAGTPFGRREILDWSVKNVSDPTYRQQLSELRNDLYPTESKTARFPMEQGELPFSLRRSIPKNAGKFVTDAIKGGASWYDEWMVDRMERLGGDKAAEAGSAMRGIIDRAKEVYGELTPTLDPAKTLAAGSEMIENSRTFKKLGKTISGIVGQIPSLTQLRAVHWANKLTETPRYKWTAVSNVVGMFEGGATVPPFAQRLADAAKAANLDIGKALESVSHFFKATGKFQRNFTAAAYDIVRNGRGLEWRRWTKGLALENGMPVDEVRQIFRDMKEELDKPGIDIGHLEKMNQDFNRKLPKVVTHLKVNGMWEPLVHADLFNYLENTAQRAAHLKAFRETFPNTPAGRLKLEEMRKSVSTEMGASGQASFDALIKTMQGIPTDQYTPGFPGQAARTINNTVGNLLAKMALTGQIFVQPGENLAGSTPVFLGYKNYIRGMARIAELYPELEKMGAVNRAMHDFSVNQNSPIRSAFRAAGNVVSKASMQQALNELQEASAAATAHVVAERISTNNLTKWEKRMLPQTFKAMGFNPEEIAGIMQGDEALLGQFVRKAAAFLTSGNRAISEGSKIGANRLVNSIFRFQSYPMMKINQLRKVTGNMAEAWTSGNAQQKRASTEMFARFMLGNTMQGAATVAITSLFFGGATGLGITLKEAADQKFKFLVESFMATATGPLYLAMRGMKDKGTPGVTDSLLRMIFPYSATTELMDMTQSKGRYRDQDVTERIGTFIGARTPGTRALAQGLALFGLSRDDKKLDTAMTALFRWKRDKFGFDESRQYLKDDPSKEFKIQMRKAVMAMRRGDVDAFQDAYMAAAGEKADLGKKGGVSFSARKVMRTATGEPLDEDQKEELRQRIGDDAVDRLEYYDLMLDAAGTGTMVPGYDQ